MSTKPAPNEEIFEEILNLLAADPVILYACACVCVVMQPVAQRGFFRRLCARASCHLRPRGWRAVGKRRAVLTDAADRRRAKAPCRMHLRTRICAALGSQDTDNGAHKPRYDARRLMACTLSTSLRATNKISITIRGHIDTGTARRENKRTASSSESWCANISVIHRTS
jgi:hypothetical protein